MAAAAAAVGAEAVEALNVRARCARNARCRRGFFSLDRTLLDKTNYKNKLCCLCRNALPGVFFLSSMFLATVCPDFDVA